MRSLVPEQALPEGHPFEVAATVIWTGTTAADGDGAAYVVDLFAGDGNNSLLSLKSALLPAWCVRGGLGGSTD